MFIANNNMKKLKLILIPTVLFALVISNTGCKKEKNSNNVPQTTDSIVVKMDASDWDYYGTSTEKYYVPTPGIFEITNEGVKGFGQISRYGAFLVTRDGFDVNNRTVYMKWKGNNANQFSGFAISLTNSGYIYSGSGLTNFTDLSLCSTPTTFGGSAVVANNTWHYTTVTVANNQFTTKTATGNYADKGGTIVENKSGSLIKTKGSISLRVGDPYAGNSAYVIVGELKIK
jgi:hypothetical protein